MNKNYMRYKANLFVLYFIILLTNIYGKFQKSVEYFVTECRWLNHGEKQLKTFGEITIIIEVLFYGDKLIEELD